MALGTHLLAGFIYVVPKVGPLVDLSLRGPSATAEKDYIHSLLDTTDALRATLDGASSSDGLPNADLDTGDGVHPGSYPLEDYAYADLLRNMTRDPSSQIPFGIKRDLLAYFADMGKVKYIQANPKKLAQVEAELPILQKLSTKAQYPASALLPEPEVDKPEGTSPAAKP